MFRRVFDIIKNEINQLIFRLSLVVKVLEMPVHICFILGRAELSGKSNLVLVQSLDDLNSYFDRSTTLKEK